MNSSESMEDLTNIECNQTSNPDHEDVSLDVTSLDVNGYKCVSDSNNLDGTMIFFTFEIEFLDYVFTDDVCECTFNSVADVNLKVSDDSTCSVNVQEEINEDISSDQVLSIDLTQPADEETYEEVEWLNEYFEGCIIIYLS